MIENHQITSLKGVFAAVLTPLKSDLSVDNVRLYKHCDWLLNNGCDGLSVLEPQEKQILLAFQNESNYLRLSVILGYQATA